MRKTKRNLAVFLSALMMFTGFGTPAVAEEETSEEKLIRIVYGLGEGTVEVNGKEAEPVQADGTQKYIEVKGKEGDTLTIKAKASGESMVYDFDEIAGLKGDEDDTLTPLVKDPVKEVTQTIAFDGDKTIQIHFEDMEALNAIETYGTACGHGQYAGHGASGMADFGMTQLGTPYGFNTQGWATYDCSGFVARAGWAIGWDELWNCGSSTDRINAMLLSHNTPHEDIDLRAENYTASNHPRTKKGDIVVFFNAGFSGTTHTAIMLDGDNMVGALYQGETNAIPISRWIADNGGGKAGTCVRIFHLTPEAPPEQPTTVSVSKTSKKPDVTNGNDLYSMEGAEYGIYSNRECTDLKTTVRLDRNGNGTSGSFKMPNANPTVMYAKETKAPANGSYKLNPEVISFTVQNGTGHFDAKDEPINDPLTIQIAKLSEDGTVIDKPASMEGAEFTVRYYNHEYNSVNDLKNVKPTKTWVLRTKKRDNGMYGAWLSDEFKVGGDDFYRMPDGTPILYLGTVTIEETKAPKGYTTEGAISHKVNNQTGEAELVNGVALYKILNENGNVSFKTANGLGVDGAEISKTEKNVRGSLEVNKTDSELGGQPQAGATALNARFTLHNDNAYDVVLRGENDEVLGKAKAGEDADYVIEADASGHWKSGKNFLPVGRYTLRETTAPNGYNGTNATYTFEIKEGQTTAVSREDFKNEIKRGGFKVQKHDAQTGTRPQGDTNLKISFKIVNKNGNPVVVNGHTYEPEEVVYENTTNDAGYYESANNLLPFGHYAPVETKQESFSR